METKYPTLRRPKRKLCYLTNKDSGSKKLSGSMTLEDVDKLFDDLDSPPHGSDSSSLLLTSDTMTPHSDRVATQEGHQSKKSPPCKKGPERSALSATWSPSPQKDKVSDIFKLREPVKTSSPIEEVMNVVDEEEEGNARKQVMSPILFDCEDEGKEQAKMQPATIQEPQVNGPVTEIIDGSISETPPSKFAFKRPTVSTKKNKADRSCKDPVTEKPCEKPQTDVFEFNENTPRQEKNTGKPVEAVTQEPELTAADKQSTSVPGPSLGQTFTRVGADMSMFLQKLRDAGQSKPACGRKTLTAVKVPPPPPEPEDNFLILEDDAPLWFTIPNKTSTGKRQKQSRTDSSDKDSSTDKATKDSLETGQKEVQLEKAELGIPPVDLSTKRKKKREKKKNKVTGPGDDTDELTTPEDLPACDLVEQEKPNKKKRQQQLKKIPSQESDRAEEEPIDTASRKTIKEKLSQKTEKRKTLRSSKDGTETAETNTAQSLKRTRKVMKGPGEVKKTMSDEEAKEQSEHHNKKPGDVEDLGSLSDKQTAKDSTAGKRKHNKSSPSEESPVLGKRTSKTVGEWWMSCSQGTEKTKVPDNHRTHKRSKQNTEPSMQPSMQPSTQPSNVKALPVKTKKDKVFSKRNQKRPVKSISQSTTKVKEKKTRQNKNRPAGGDATNNLRATDVVLNTTDSEQIEEQQQQPEEEVLDQDLDVGPLSPMASQEGDISHNSGHRVFHKGHHNESNEKMSDTSASLSPRGHQKNLRIANPGKRRRKPPGNWWATNSMSEEVEGVSSHPQQLKPKEAKSHNERKQLSKRKPGRSPGLGTPKKCNTVVASKTPGGADVPLLKPKPVSAAKTIGRTMATFKDIFRSASETPTVVGSRDTGRSDRCGVMVIQRVPFSQTDRHSVDAGESRDTQNSPPTHDSPQDSSCQPENTLIGPRSGPSSMVAIQEYENLTLQPSSVPVELSVLDLCAPPLKPLVLQPRDKADLAEWFKTLWSSTVDDDPEITPDHFHWYFYQGRVCGFQVDLNCGYICHGKILLGSYMKKPLWVDHYATTIFNILTSSVDVIIDGKKSHFSPGTAFMVQSGNAYTLHNVTAQPAVLYFTRILAESSE